MNILTVPLIPAEENNRFDFYFSSLGETWHSDLLQIVGHYILLSILNISPDGPVIHLARQLLHRESDSPEYVVRR